MLLVLVTVAWVLWVIGSPLALAADKREGKRPQDAGFSILPVIPLLPLLFFGAANVIDGFARPWGARIVGGFHLLLIVVYLIGIVYEVRRIQSANRPAE